MGERKTLSDTQKNILRLIRRSTPVDGWYSVSATVWSVVETANMPSDLVEFQERDGAHFLRLTPSGEAVTAYLV